MLEAAWGEAAPTSVPAAVELTLAVAAAAAVAVTAAVVVMMVATRAPWITRGGRIITRETTVMM